MSVLLKELISSHNTTESRSVATQTEVNALSLPLDSSFVSVKSNRSKRKRNHGLVSNEFKTRKPKKVKEVTIIAQNLEKMANNISAITNKLEDFKKDPNQDQSKTIIGHVGTIMGQLNGCIGNFESLCRDIKQINETRNRNYDEWMDDLKNSENGRRFVKKLQKSFSRVLNEEKSKIQKDYRKKLEREKSKLAKLHRSSAHKAVVKKPGAYPETGDITKEINEIFQNTCLMIKNVEKESVLFEKSLSVNIPRRQAAKSTKALSDIITKQNPPPVKLNLDDCQQIHSDSSSLKTDPRYGSTSFEGTDENN